MPLNLPAETKITKVVPPESLTEEQELQIINEWNNRPANPPSILELIKIAFPKVEIVDARSREGRLIKQFLATRDLKATNPYANKILVLTEEQKQYIKNHSSFVKPLKLAQDLFNEPKLSPLSKEFLVIAEFVKQYEIETGVRNTSTEEVEAEEFRPPKSILQAAARVNKYIREGIILDTLTKNTKLQECLKAMIRFCHTPRFVLLMNSFVDDTERKLFESSYVRYIWDKPDLTEEEIDSYLNLCCDIVSYNRILEEIGSLKLMRDDALTDSDGKKLSLSIVEMISTLNKELDDNHKRQTKALENLQGKRADRFDSKIKQNQSFLQIVDMWRDEKERLRLIKFAEERKKVTKEELEKLDSLEEMLAQVYGVNQSSY